MPMMHINKEECLRNRERERIFTLPCSREKQKQRERRGKRKDEKGVVWSEEVR